MSDQAIAAPGGGPAESGRSAWFAAGAGTARLEAHAVFKSYGQVLGVSDVSLSLGPGVHGLLGPNGAGKSTLMKLLTGQLRPDRGRVAVLGRSAWNQPEIFTVLGFCPEQDAFYESLSGSTFLQSLARLHGLEPGAAAAAAAQALQRVGLEPEVWARRIGGYSKGMRQRLKLAQALLHRPEILILDEPLGGLDPVGRRAMVELIRSLGEQGHTVLVSSHVLHEIESMTASVVLLVNGRVAAEGNVHEIRALIDHHPHHVAVQCADPRALAAALVRDPDIVSLEFGADPRTLELTTRRPDRFYPRLTATVLELRLEIERLTSPDDNLPAVFRYLTQKASG